MAKQHPPGAPRVWFDFDGLVTVMHTMGWKAIPCLVTCTIVNREWFKAARAAITRLLDLPRLPPGITIRGLYDSEHNRLGLCALTGKSMCVVELAGADALLGGNYRFPTTIYPRESHIALLRIQGSQDTAPIYVFPYEQRTTVVDIVTGHQIGVQQIIGPVVTMHLPIGPAEITRINGSNMQGLRMQRVQLLINRMDQERCPFRLRYHKSDDPVNFYAILTPSGIEMVYTRQWPGSDQLAELVMVDYHTNSPYISFDFLQPSTTS